MPSKNTYFIKSDANCIAYVSSVRDQGIYRAELSHIICEANALQTHIFARVCNF